MLGRGVKRFYYSIFALIRRKKFCIQKKSIRIVTVLLSVASISSLYGDQLRNQFNHFSIHNGLSQVSVVDIIQDKKGFYGLRHWMASTNTMAFVSSITNMIPGITIHFVTIE